MTLADGTTLIAHIDCPGGGQIRVDGDRLYIGHITAPAGTSIYDISDPTAPVLLSRIEMPDGWHSHKVRAVGDIMIVNRERLVNVEPDGRAGGLSVFDVSDPREPRQIGDWATGGRGVHRFDFDGRYAYISTTADGYRSNIVVILDLDDPANPTEIARWWVPGQWVDGGEDYPTTGHLPAPRCHHPLRLGDRLYVSYWHHGFYILDISELTRPVAVAGWRPSTPAYPAPTHTALALARPVKGRRYMIVADEDAGKIAPAPPAVATVYDITEEALPTPVATLQVPGVDIDGSPQEEFTGCHQPSEVFTGTVIPFAWFASGLQVFDLAEPLAPRRIAQYIPDPAPGYRRVSSNDVTMDDRGLIYLLDRLGGVDIVRLDATA